MQANSSIFVQSHTADFINCTTSASVTTSAPTQHKKIEQNVGRWESGSLIEPLQIHLPATNFTTTGAIKTERNHSGSSTSSTSSSSSKNPTSTNKRAAKAAKGNKNINDCILNLHQQHQSKSTCETKVESNNTGCSRTVPLTWNQALQQLQNNVNTSCASSYGNCSSADTTTHTTATLLQIKREPCQVSEVTTSNNLIATTSFSGTPAIIKIEQKSPTTTSSSFASISSSMDSNNTSGGQQNSGNLFFYCNSNLLVTNCDPFFASPVFLTFILTAGAAIPIGIAVGRQRLQETTNQTLPQLQPKDLNLNRFSLGLAELGELNIPINHYDINLPLSGLTEFNSFYPRK